MSDTDQFVARRMPDWLAFRRDLHRFPELGFLEFRTISRLARQLAGLGYDLRLGADVMRQDARSGVPAPAVIAAAQEKAIAAGADPEHVARMRNGMTGLVAELRRGPGPVIAMRFDVDALPIREQQSNDHAPSRLGFASAEPGVMHACGHDGHATIGLGVAETAARPELNWTGTLRLIFQPAEEGGRGAHPMVEAGVVDDADAFVALHLGCDLPTGRIACAASDMLFSAKWNLCYRGLSAHAAGSPENGRNALLAAAQAVTGLYGLPRHGRFATHVNVGRMEGGSARNAIPDHATLEIELRGGVEEALEHMERRARLIVESAATAHGCEVSIDEMGRTIGAHSTQRMAERIGAVAGSLADVEQVLETWPIGGGDDAAFFMRRVQQNGGEAAYLILGSDLAAGHHATNFDFTERDIGLGVRLMAGILEKATKDGVRKRTPTTEPVA